MHGTSTALNLPTVYGALYLAVAELEGCELWTADSRFAKLASSAYPFVRCVTRSRLCMAEV